MSTNREEILVEAGWKKNPQGAWRNPEDGRNYSPSDAWKIAQKFFCRCPVCGLNHHPVEGCSGLAVSHE